MKLIYTLGALLKRLIFSFSLLLLFFLTIGESMADSKKEDLIYLELKNGRVVIETKPDIAPNHVKRIKELVSEGFYDGIVFHRVIDGFMAQTGDVQFGNSNLETFDLRKAGTGGSEYSDLKAEFSDIPHERGTLSMARSSNPNSANSQFFICFKSASHLDRQYSVFGKVVEGMEFVDLIKKGRGSNGEVDNPDKIISLSLK